MAKKKTPTETSIPPVMAADNAPRRRAAAKPKANGDGAPAHIPPSYDQIAEAAYLRYLKRGGTHGQDVDDWIEAERSLRSRE